MVQRLFPRMSERRMPQIVSQGDRLDQILVQAQRLCYRPRDLRDLQRMRQPGPVVISYREQKATSLPVLQAYFSLIRSSMAFTTVLSTFTLA